MVSIYNSLFSILVKSTVNKIGDTGAISLSDALKSNATLTKLNLSCKTKETAHNETYQQYIVLTKLTVNKIGETGTTSLSDALKSNTTLTQLRLSCQHERNNTQIASTNNPLFPFSSNNRQQD